MNYDRLPLTLRTIVNYSMPITYELPLYNINMVKYLAVIKFMIGRQRSFVLSDRSKQERLRLMIALEVLKLYIGLFLVYF